MSEPKIIAALRHMHAISCAGGRVSITADHGEITVYIGYKGDHVHHGRYDADNKFDLDATLESAAETILELPIEAHEWPEPKAEDLRVLDKMLDDEADR